MAVNKGKAFFKLLGHDYQRIVDRTVPVGMVFTHGIPYDTGAFPVRFVIFDSQFMHIIQNAPLDRL